MEDKELAALRAEVASKSVQMDADLAEIGRLTGERAAFKIAFGALLRQATPDARAEAADQLRKLLSDKPSLAPGNFNDGWASTATDLIAQLEAV